MTGPRLALENERLRVSVLPELGAGLGEAVLKRDGAELPLLRSWNGSSTDPSRLACFLLVPWSNRISGGGITVGGEFHPLAPNRPGEPCPIHGEGFERPWRVDELRPDLVRLSFESALRPPFAYRAEVLYALEGASIVMRLAVEHRGAKPAPYGLGFHPWFPRTPGVTLEAPARTVWLERPDHLPDREVPVAERPEWDFTSERPLPDGWINNGFTGWNGRARIRWPELDLGLAIEAEPVLSTYMLFSPSATADFFCLEPVSHPVDAFHLPGGPEAHGLRLLEEGGRLGAALRLTPESGR